MRYAKQLEDTLRLQQEAHNQLVEIQRARKLLGDQPRLLEHVEMLLDSSIKLYNLECVLDDQALYVKLEGDFKGWILTSDP